MIKHFKHKNLKLKEKFEKYKMITTMKKTFDRLGIFAITSSCITLSPKGIGLIAIPISSSIACGLTISNKTNYEVVMQKDNTYKKLVEKHHQAIVPFDKLYRKS